MDLNQLYQEIIIDHNKNPKNFNQLEDYSNKAIGHNPLCGDKLVVYVKTNNDLIEKVSFLGDGCAISKASASLMTEWATGKKISEFLQQQERFHYCVTHHDADGSSLGKLQVLLGVRQYPSRVKCATLAWHTLVAALKNETTAKTE